MKNNTPYFILFLLLLTTLYSCKKKIHADFSYEPSQPKIGEVVTFTNLSDGGEDFDWTFTNERTGSKGYSILENPTRTFTTPGNYSITLRVDSNNNFVRTRELYVYDSIPSITRNVTTAYYYQSIKFSAIAYNLYNRATTFQWFFSPNAKGENLTDTIVDNIDLKVSYEATPTVFFIERGAEEIVSLRMTIGDSIYTTEQIKKDTFSVHDIKTRSLVFAGEDGTLWQQRIFINGIEAAQSTGINLPPNAYNFVANDNKLYIFSAGDETTPGSISTVNMDGETYSSLETIITNETGDPDYGFYNGYVENENIYWTDRYDHVYKIGKVERNKTFELNGADPSTSEYYFVGVNALGYDELAPGQYNGGFYVFNDTYFWAKGGTGNGIYRFKAEDISNTQKPSSGAILNEYAIRAFAYDRNNGQIYFSAKKANDNDSVGLWVSDLDGLKVRTIEKYLETADNPDCLTSIAIDYSEKPGKIFWSVNSSNSTNSGIKQTKMIYTSGQTPDANDIKYFNNQTSVQGIALDETPKLGIAE